MEKTENKYSTLKNSGRNEINKYFICKNNARPGKNEEQGKHL